MNILPKLRTLHCNHCNQAFTGAESGAACPSCNAGVLLVRAPQDSQEESKPSWKVEVKSLNRQHAAKLRQRADSVETSAKVLYGIGAILLLIGIVTLFRSVADPDAITSSAWFFWAGAFGLFAFLETLIAQLLFIRAAVEGLNQ